MLKTDALPFLSVTIEYPADNTSSFHLTGKGGEMTRSGIILIRWKARYYCVQMCFWKVVIKLWGYGPKPHHSPDQRNSCPEAASGHLSPPSLPCSIVEILRYVLCLLKLCYPGPSKHVSGTNRDLHEWIWDWNWGWHKNCRAGKERIKNEVSLVRQSRRFQMIKVFPLFLGEMDLLSGRYKTH